MLKGNSHANIDDLLRKSATHTAFERKDMEEKHGVVFCGMDSVFRLECSKRQYEEFYGDNNYGAWGANRQFEIKGSQSIKIIAPNVDTCHIIIARERKTGNFWFLHVPPHTCGEGVKQTYKLLPKGNPERERREQENTKLFSFLAPQCEDSKDNEVEVEKVLRSCDVTIDIVVLDKANHFDEEQFKLYFPGTIGEINNFKDYRITDRCSAYQVCYIPEEDALYIQSNYDIKQKQPATKYKNVFSKLAPDLLRQSSLAQEFFQELKEDIIARANQNKLQVHPAITLFYPSHLIPTDEKNDTKKTEKKLPSHVAKIWDAISAINDVSEAAEIFMALSTIGEVLFDTNPFADWDPLGKRDENVHNAYYQWAKNFIERFPNHAWSIKLQQQQELMCKNEKENKPIHRVSNRETCLIA